MGIDVLVCIIVNVFALMNVMTFNCRMHYFNGDDDVFKEAVTWWWHLVD